MLNIDQKWRKKEDGTMELIEEIEVEREVVEVVTPIELLQQENLLLKAQVQANSEISDFHEELIFEMAMMVYQ